MEIKTTTEEGRTTLAFSGRLDTTTAPEAETTATAAASETKDLTFDFKDLDYLSSAGLRVILATHKKMTAKGGCFAVQNVNDIIMKVFNITGFSGIITIK